MFTVSICRSPYASKTGWAPLVHSTRPFIRHSGSCPSQLEAVWASAMPCRQWTHLAWSLQRTLAALLVLLFTWSRNPNTLAEILHCFSRFFKANVRTAYAINSMTSFYVDVVLYGCENWSLTLREECRRRVFENRELKRKFGPKRDEVTGEWRRLRNDELCGLYFWPNIVRVIKLRRGRWAGGIGVLWHGMCVGKERCVQSFDGETWWKETT